jgi:hypothetical protein
MKDKIQKLIAEIIGDGFTVEVKPVAVKPVSGSVYSVASVYGAGVIDESSVLKPLSGGNVSSDFGAGVTTYLSVYTDGEGDEAIYVNGKLELHEVGIYATELAKVADGRLVRMSSAVLDDSFAVGKWPEYESELKEMIDGYQAGIDAGAAIGAPDRDGLVLRSEWNAKEGCFEDSRVEPEKYSEWEPKIDGWVRLPEGKVAKVKCVKIVNGTVLYGFHGTNIMYTLGALKPWTPSVGDKVVVNKLGRIADGKVGVIVECVKGDAGEYAVRLDRENLTSFNLRAEQLELIEPAEDPTDHNADATKTANPSVTPNSSSSEPLAIPEGWRELEPDEVPKTGDDVDIDGQWIDLLSDCNVESRYYSRRIIRKIEPANPSETPNSSTAKPGYFDDVEGVWVDEREPFDGRKVEPVKEPQYREPTNDDIGKRVEVRDSEKAEWNDLIFVVILPPGDFRFCAEDDHGNRCGWRFARIKAC